MGGGDVMGFLLNVSSAHRDEPLLLIRDQRLTMLWTQDAQLPRWLHLSWTWSLGDSSVLLLVRLSVQTHPSSCLLAVAQQMRPHLGKEGTASTAQNSLEHLTQSWDPDSWVRPFVRRPHGLMSQICPASPK